MRKEYIKRIRMVLESDMKNKDLIKDLNARAVSTRGPSCARQITQIH